MSNGSNPSRKENAVIITALESGGDLECDGVDVTLLTVCDPTGLIFYPGGRVEPEAYAPPLTRIGPA